jgi:hypothetical protein
MSEALVESAMQWSLRTGKFQHGDRSFLEFAQMLQVGMLITFLLGV